MGESCFSRVLLLSSLLLLIFSNGYGRKMVDRSEHPIAAFEQGKSREIFELDYVDAGPNFNGRSGYLLSPPSPQTPPPPPPPSPPPP